MEKMMQDVFQNDFEPIEIPDKVSMETHQNLKDVFGLNGICCMRSMCTCLLGLPLMSFNVQFIVNV